MIKPISKKKYYETISEQIEQAILSGEWAEGSRVPTEDELAGIFQVGRGSIREAITNLQMSGILVSSPGIGTYVADNAVSCINNHQLADMLNDPESIDEMAKARKVLEPQLASYAAENASADDLKRMKKAIEKAKSISSLDEWKDYGHLFDIALAESCKSKILISLFKSIEEPTRKVVEGEMTIDLVDRWVSGYQAVYNAIEQKDPVLASQRMSAIL